MRSFVFNKKRARESLSALLVAFAIFIFAGCATTGLDTSLEQNGTQEQSSPDKQKAAGELKVGSIDVLGEGDNILIATNKTAEYTAFTLTSPLRLVIDLPDANLYDVLDTIRVNNQFVKTINVVTYGGKEKIGRIILNLQEGVDHKVSNTDDGVLIHLTHDPLAGLPEGSMNDEGEAVVVVASASDVTLADSPAEQEPVQSEPLEPATTVEDLQTFTEDSELVIQIVSDGAIGKYNTFELSDPSRVVIDVWDVTNKTGLNVLRVDGTDIKDVRVGNHSDKVRFVIDLTGEEIPPYVVTRSGDHITVAFGATQALEEDVSAGDNFADTSVNDNVAFASDTEQTGLSADLVADETAAEGELPADEAPAEAEQNYDEPALSSVVSNVAFSAGEVAASAAEDAVLAAVATEDAAVAAEEDIAVVAEDTSATLYDNNAPEEETSAMAQESIDEAVSTPTVSTIAYSADARAVAGADEALASAWESAPEEAATDEVAVVAEEQAVLDTVEVAVAADEEMALATEEVVPVAVADNALVSEDITFPAVDKTAEEDVTAAMEESPVVVAANMETIVGDSNGEVSDVIVETDAEIADAIKGEQAADAAFNEENVGTTIETTQVEPVAEVAQEAPAAPSAPVISAGNSIKNIDFKKIGDKGFLTIETTEKPVYTLKESKNRSTIVLDISDALIAGNLIRTLDATKLGTPVATISSYQSSTAPAVTRVLINLSTVATHSVMEIDGTLNIVFAPIAKPVVKTSAVKAGDELLGKNHVYTGKKIDLDMMDARITDILRLLAEVSDLNIIASDEVTGTISLRLRDVPWDQAFDIILQSKGLDKVKVGNVIRVAPAVRISQERDAALAAVKASEKLEPLGIDYIAINYAQAAVLEKHVKNVLSVRGSVTSEKRTNTLIIKDIKKGIRDARNLVSRLDTPIPQVLIEARIVEASSSFSRDLGIQWGVDYQTGGNVSTNLFGSGVDSTGLPATGQTPPNGINPAFQTRNGAQNFAINLPATGSIGTLGALGFILGKAGQNPLVLDLRLSAGEQEGQLRTISRPRIVTMDNKEAKIEDGESIPFETTSAAGTSTIFIDANLSLTVTPHITPDGSVLMKIKASKNSIGTFTTSSGEPSIVKKEASTEVLVSDGETTVIGGIISSDSNHVNSGIPYLKDIPLVGKLFRSKSTKESQKELLIFITPTILKMKSTG